MPWGGGGGRNGPAVRPADTAAEPNRQNLTGRAEPPLRVPPVHSVQPEIDRSPNLRTGQEFPPERTKIPSRPSSVAKPPFPMLQLGVPSRQTPELTAGVSGLTKLAPTPCVIQVGVGLLRIDPCLSRALSQRAYPCLLTGAWAPKFPNTPPGTLPQRILFVEEVTPPPCPPKTAPS